MLLLQVLILTMCSLRQISAKEWVASNICYIGDMERDFCYNPEWQTISEESYWRVDEEEKVMYYHVPQNVMYYYKPHEHSRGGFSSVDHKSTSGLALSWLALSRRPSDWLGSSCSIFNSTTTLEWVACEGLHVVGFLIASLGVKTFSSLISNYIVKPFLGRSPDVSIGFGDEDEEGDHMRVSVSTFRDGESVSRTYYDVGEFTANCEKQDYSVQLRVDMDSGVAETVCVSWYDEREKGFVMSVRWTHRLSTDGDDITFIG
ncbi:hypothetical protein BZA70DRAFT_302877 [Myxozyma melibiosi]|uniref:Uncharacterized protein n=1 Tax=Myxozyma melibiosi TaxID=54550 RepID=A0ABR1EY43_9ASCO